MPSREAIARVRASLEAQGVTLEPEPDYDTVLAEDRARGDAEAERLRQMDEKIAAAPSGRLEDIAPAPVEVNDG